jgi:BirA family biotin operon repressor/biotin-[acetyl-CoA-carboxylase] ligase
MKGVRFHGLDALALARRLDLPYVLLLSQTSSTMDEAHALAAQGARAGTLVLAQSQTAGRGRSGGTWIGVDGESILCTIIERPASATALTVLSLRVGLGVAAALDAFADETIGLKWPNDLLIDGGKVAGILIEARWRNTQPDWVAIAIGLNAGSAPPGMPRARGLKHGTSRLSVLSAIVPAMRVAAHRVGPLTDPELAAWKARDRLAGRRVSAPVAGVIGGILPTGELLIETADGPAALRSGSVTLEEA